MYLNKKILVIIIAVLLFGVFLFLELKDQEESDQNEDPYFDVKQECERVGGTWEYYSNGCVDSCDLERTPESISCIQAFTWGCNCGGEMCWNGKTCEDN